MKNASAILFSMLTVATVCFADVPTDLRGKPKENKLNIHICELSLGDRLKASLMANQEDIFRLARCSILSDINYSSSLQQLSTKSYHPIIHSRETVNVKKGIDPRTGVVTGALDWKTCDAEDGDCIEWSTGAFDGHVENYFMITPDQQRTILSKLVENSGNKNTDLFFLQHGLRIDQRTADGIFTNYNLKDVSILVK